MNLNERCDFIVKMLSNASSPIPSTEILTAMLSAGVAETSTGAPYTTDSLYKDITRAREKHIIRYINGGYYYGGTIDNPRKGMSKIEIAKDKAQKKSLRPSLAEINAKARALGMSYGKYMWYIEQNGGRKR